MSRNPPQDAPTAPRPRDANGYELAEDGLPINGPARARALAAREAEPSPSAPPPPQKLTEKEPRNG